MQVLNYLVKKILNWDWELSVNRSQDIISSMDNIGRFVMYVGGNRSPGGNLRCQRESPSLSHEEWVWPGIEPTNSEVTGADLTTAPLWQLPCLNLILQFKFKSKTVFFQMLNMRISWRCSIQRDQFQSPYCPHRAMRLLGACLHQNTGNIPAIVLWWYRVDRSDRDTRCMQLEPWNCSLWRTTLMEPLRRYIRITFELFTNTTAGEFKTCLLSDVAKCHNVFYWCNKMVSKPIINSFYPSIVIFYFWQTCLIWKMFEETLLKWYE
jgi:hypothetical protein